MIRSLARTALLTTILCGLLYAGLWWQGRPTRLFQTPQATLLTDAAGRVLGGHTSAEGQWHWKSRSDSVPVRLRLCILTFEDRHFFTHCGVDAAALAAAFWSRLAEGQVRRGGSTLTMQVARMDLHPNKKRTLWRKLREMGKALALETRYSKAEILRLWADHAPFGGNVVGVEAAAWRYFGKAPEALSWAEAALLSVLPNRPARLHLGRGRQELLHRRNLLLNSLYLRGHLSAWELELALSEPLPEGPLPLPQLVPHLASRPGLGWICTTLDAALQERCLQLAATRGALLQAAGVHNVALLVAHTPSGSLRAYVGNNPVALPEHGAHVDILSAPRSYGSLFKPILYAACLHDGLVLPPTLIPDYPMVFGHYAPRNFDHHYRGAVPARLSVSRSLNIPSVWLLRQFGPERFLNLLRAGGLQSLSQPASHYGLTLILGGGECTPLEAAGLYVRAAHVLLGQDSLTESLYYRPDQARRVPIPPQFPGAPALWYMTEAMRQVNLPDMFAFWEADDGRPAPAWKTGTSYRHRDAWAVALTPEHTVLVWAGNADGRPVPGLTGVQAAAPLLFDVLSVLEPWGTFPFPLDRMVPAEVCRESGLRRGPDCPETDTLYIPPAGWKVPPCPYHRRVLVDPSSGYRVGGDCPAGPPEPRIVFQLPPLMETYYAAIHPEYQPPPPLHPACGGKQASEGGVMALVMPYNPKGIIPEKNAAGRNRPVVFEIVHGNPLARLWWFVDNKLVGSTRAPHKLSLALEPGSHHLVVADQEGHFLGQSLFVY